MRKDSAFALLALVCISTTSLAQDPKKFFSVPFFIENLPPAMPSVLRADFTLQQPAILETLSVDCSGPPRGGLLFADGGPLGLHGTTGVASNPQVGLVVGSLVSNWVRMDFSASSIGHYIYPTTHFSLPVKSNFTFLLFPTPGQGIACFATAVFQSVN